MGRSPCCDESSGLKKGPWTPEEDEKLVEFIQKNGHGSWRALPKRAGLNRCGKSCRLRWTNYLRPGIKRGEFTEEEDEAIIHLHSVLGNKWSRIAAHLSGRTDNEIKNYWNTHLRKKLLQRGIDPKTHKPITDLNLLANLSQLLSPPNFGNLMNQWDNALIRSQVDPNHLAKIQIVQSIMQAINTTTPFPNLSDQSTSLLSDDPHINIAHLGGVLNGTTTLYNTPQPAPFDFPNLGENHPQLFDTYPAVTSNSMESFEAGFQPEFVGVNYTTTTLTTDYSTDHRTENGVLPPLVSHFGEIISPRGRQLQDSKIHTPTVPFTHSPNSNLFEDWQKFLDDEAHGAPWKDLLA